MKDNEKFNLTTCLTPVSPSAKAVLDTLTEGLTDIEHHTKFDNGGACIMPVSVECIGEIEAGKLFSVAHYYTQNSDLMRDPEITFLKDGDANYYPLSYQQDNLAMYQEAVSLEYGEIGAVKLKTQKRIAQFCGTWMKNIKDQQLRDREE